jgi:hypothetical protein
VNPGRGDDHLDLRGRQGDTRSGFRTLLMLVPAVGMRVYNGYEGYSWERYLYAADKPKVMASDQKALEKEEKPGPHALSPGLPPETH